MSQYRCALRNSLVKLDAMENPCTSCRTRCGDAIGERLGARADQPLSARQGRAVTAALAAGTRGDRRDAGLMVGERVRRTDRDRCSVACNVRVQTVLALRCPAFVHVRLSAQLARLTFVGVPLRPDFELDVKRRCWPRSSGTAGADLTSPTRTNPAGDLFDERDRRAHRRCRRCAGRADGVRRGLSAVRVAQCLYALPLARAFPQCARRAHACRSSALSGRAAGLSRSRTAALIRASF